MSLLRFLSTVLPFYRNVCVSQILLEQILNDLWYEKTYISRLNQQLLIGLYIFLIQSFV